jgi:ectoine hydroxylase-related dioxygenase (phytanoyl-CoA dioxygenase family)
MLKRMRPGGYLVVREDPVPEASVQLERDGYAIVRGAFTPDEIAAAKAEIESIYEQLPPDGRGGNKRGGIEDDFRYEMFNRSGLSQQLVGRREILDVIDPLLGEDAHIIANTCWRNPARAEHRHGGGAWHIDAGPHIPLGPDQSWPEDIPHPVFAIGVHVFLMDCPLACGPTGVISGSHRSGLFPPAERLQDVDLQWQGEGVTALTARAGDVALFVSDVWHRRLPTSDEDKGRFFLQIHYARRDIAQRIKPTSIINHLQPESIERISSDRERHLLGLHAMGFYDG